MLFRSKEGAERWFEVTGCFGRHPGSESGFIPSGMGSAPKLKGPQGIQTTDLPRARGRARKNVCRGWSETMDTTCGSEISCPELKDRDGAGAWGDNHDK